MKNYKSKKIFKIINNSNKYLNLHEIKTKLVLEMDIKVI